MDNAQLLVNSFVCSNVDTASGYMSNNKKTRPVVQICFLPVLC